MQASVTAILLQLPHQTLNYNNVKEKDSKVNLTTKPSQHTEFHHDHLRNMKENEQRLFCFFALP